MSLFKRRLSKEESAALYPLFLGRAAESQEHAHSSTGTLPRKAAKQFIASPEFRWGVVNPIMMAKELPHESLQKQYLRDIVDLLVSQFGGDRA